MTEFGLLIAICVVIVVSYGIWINVTLWFELRRYKEHLATQLKNRKKITLPRHDI